MSLRQLLADVDPTASASKHADVVLLAPSVSGGVADTILKSLADRPPGLLVMGSRGRGVVQKFFAGLIDTVLFANIGSVSDAVLRKATWPVCIVHGPPPTKVAAPPPYEEKARSPQDKRPRSLDSAAL